MEASVAEQRTERIEFPSNEHTTPGYLAQPDDGASHPAIVVIQEWWGLVPHIEEVARRLSGEGFIALAPDLYHGHQAAEPDEARKLAMALERDTAVAEILAAASYLADMERVEPKKIGVVGWCMGGGLALSAAADDGDLGGVVAFYGRPLSVDDTARLHIPVLALYAEHDHSITADDIEAFEAAMAEHGVPHQVHTYAGTQHAFFNDTRPGIYNPIAAADAWRRTLAWFRLHLSADPD